MSDSWQPVVPDAALSWRFSRSPGAGGQHVNKTSTQVELTCDLAACDFGHVLTGRLINKLGPVVQVTVNETRSQRRNRDLALERLLDILRAAAVVPKRRRQTRPGRGAVARRLKSKREASERKANRTWRPSDD